MPPEVLNFLTAAWELIVAWLLQPHAAIAVGCFWAGFAIGSAKNKSAFAEIGRGLLSGLAAGAVVYVVQLLIRSGGAA